MSVVDSLHGSYVVNRRVAVLAKQIATLLPKASRVLDVGCGDGTLARTIMTLRADLSIVGIDVLVRQRTAIQVTQFDGTHIPAEARAYDAVLLVDVLHHADQPSTLLDEAARVSRGCIIIKDHLNDGPFSESILRFMDRVGNARHGVALPYRYWSRSEWDEAFERLGVRPNHWDSNLKIYPFWADWLFGGGLHFLARLVSELH